MNYISSFFGGSAPSDEDQKKKEFLAHLKSCEGIFKIIAEEEVEDILCQEIQEVEFSKLVKTKDGQR